MMVKYGVTAEDLDTEGEYRWLDVGIVPDGEIAIMIAEAAWLPIYGISVYDNLPFVAVLEGDSVWNVRGTLPDGRVGGVPFATIRKSDGQISRLGHTK